jgi:hypothetical protein
VERGAYEKINIFDQREHRTNQTAFNMTKMTALYVNLWTYILEKEMGATQRPSVHLRSEEIELLESKVVLTPMPIDMSWMQTLDKKLLVHKQGTKLP